MVWALVDADGRLKAVADAQAGLTAGAGETVVDAGDTPLARGYRYDATSQTWSPRDDFFAPGAALAAELPRLVRERIAELSFLCFALQSLNQVRTYLDHLAECANAALIPVNQTDATKIATIRRELEINAEQWVCSATGFSTGFGRTSFATTVIPDSGAAPWTRGSDSTISIAPRTYTSRAQFAAAYTGPLDQS